jgi:hypothetical protein
MEPAEEVHLISILAAGARPWTSGAYISSTHVPVAVKVPAVVARTTYYVPGQPIRNALRAIGP